MTAPIRSAGQRRPWEYRPSDDRLGSAYHRHGPLQPLQRPSLLARIFRRG